MIFQEQADFRQRFSVNINISCFSFISSDSVVVLTCSTSSYESASVSESISISKSSLRIIAQLYRFVMLEYDYERICSVVESSRKLISISKAVYILIQINSKS